MYTVIFWYKHERIGKILQSLNGLKSLMNLNSFLARDLGLNLLSVLLQTRCQKKYNEQGYDILKRLHQNDGGKMRYERFIIRDAIFPSSPPGGWLLKYFLWINVLRLKSKLLLLFSSEDLIVLDEKNWTHYFELARKFWGHERRSCRY